ncbi:hypothetical protein AB1K62_14570 [Parasphingorhabdus sp. JC815]|uniref:hypothetical protein n=1 Tax=Parasphingorhabdus sp. JC815 TaxID=3232140 RepID=UPI0034582854
MKHTATKIERGYMILYHPDVDNHCPACGKTNWYVGRFSAECGFCSTALPLSMVDSQPMHPRFTESGVKQ